MRIEFSLFIFRHTGNILSTCPVNVTLSRSSHLIYLLRGFSLTFWHALTHVWYVFNISVEHTHFLPFNTLPLMCQTDQASWPTIVGIDPFVCRPTRLRVHLPSTCTGRPALDSTHAFTGPCLFPARKRLPTETLIQSRYGWWDEAISAIRWCSAPVPAGCRRSPAVVGE